MTERGNISYRMGSNPAQIPLGGVLRTQTAPEGRSLPKDLPRNLQGGGGTFHDKILRTAAKEKLPTVAGLWLCLQEGHRGCARDPGFAGVRVPRAHESCQRGVEDGKDAGAFEFGSSTFAKKKKKQGAHGNRVQQICG